MSDQQNEGMLNETDFKMLRYWLVRTLEKHDRDLENLKERIGILAILQEQILSVQENVKGIVNNAKGVDMDFSREMESTLSRFEALATRVGKVENDMTRNTTRIAIYGVIAGIVGSGLVGWIFNILSKVSVNG